jgi:ferredoxin
MRLDTHLRRYTLDLGLVPDPGSAGKFPPPLPWKLTLPVWIVRFRNDRDVPRGMLMKVWIDQDLCTGDGLCEEIAPAVFTLLDDGLAYVKEDDKVLNDPGGAEGMATVPSDLEDAVVEAAEECPGECIFVEKA